MIVERIRPEHIPRIVSNKPIMEHFLRVLLDEPVTLSDWPSEASCSDFSAGPDLCAVTTGGMRICLHVNLFGSETMMDELMHAAAQYLPDPVCTIVLTASDPVDLGQSYSRIAPMAVDAPVITEVESAWQIHVLSFSAEIVNRNAPTEIQQLLDHMAGKEIQPAPGSLLDRMLHEDFAWSPIADMRSQCKASIYACCAVRLKSGADRRSIRSSAQSIVNRKWAEQETERQTEIIRSAIRIGQTEVRLDGQQADSEISEYYYPSLAADRVGKEGYSFDGLAAGVDYTLETHINNEQYVVKITYSVSSISEAEAAEKSATI